MKTSENNADKDAGNDVNNSVNSVQKDKIKEYYHPINLYSEDSDNYGLNNNQPLIIYFSSVTENTHRFIEKTRLPAQRIPLIWKEENPLLVDFNYILMCPSYGGGAENKAVPKQVVKFLNVENNRNHCIGVIGSGNLNFGEHYQIAGKIISAKLKQPLMYTYELMGTQEDVTAINTNIPEVFKRLERKEYELGATTTRKYNKILKQ